MAKGGGKEVVRGRGKRRGPTIYPCGIGPSSSNCQSFTGCLASAIRHRPLEPRPHPRLHPPAPYSSAHSAPIKPPRCCLILSSLTGPCGRGFGAICPPGGYKWCYHRRRAARTLHKSLQPRAVRTSSRTATRHLFSRIFFHAFSRKSIQISVFLNYAVKVSQCEIFFG